ncbi:uncharacterized protein VTP21DRAFT_2658 [Calcarisporiella thermophila]|uniref:uncharacterized protein n=1 Tax=Calcarisporiella thermophila TaxID=911321 RepID=UPI0037440BB5
MHPFTFVSISQSLDQQSILKLSSAPYAQPGSEQASTDHTERATNTDVSGYRPSLQTCHALQSSYFQPTLTPIPIGHTNLSTFPSIASNLLLQKENINKIFPSELHLNLEADKRIKKEELGQRQDQDYLTIPGDSMTKPALFADSSGPSSNSSQAIQQTAMNNPAHQKASKSSVLYCPEQDDNFTSHYASPPLSLDFAPELDDSLLSAPRHDMLYSTDVRIPGFSLAWSNPEPHSSMPTPPLNGIVQTTPTDSPSESSCPQLRCLFCPKVFSKLYNLKSHMRSHSSERPFKCPNKSCDKAFLRRHDCDRHSKLHTGLKPYKCNMCGRSFARMDALGRHMKVNRERCEKHRR